MKSICKPLLAALFLACFAQPASAVDPRPVGLTGNFTLVFRDEFNTSLLNRNVWNDNWMGARGAITKPVNSAEIAAMDPARVTIADGRLKITAIYAPGTKATDGKTYQYRSGMVETARRKEWTYGIFEARIGATGSGQVLKNWPAFWTNGHHDRVGNGRWPSAGENDIVENLSGGPAWHYHSPTARIRRVGERTTVSGSWGGFHIYTAEWVLTPTGPRIYYYYDGVHVGSQTSGVLSYPHYIVINYALSTQHGGPLVVPANMQVDYVRVWKRN